MEVYKLLVIVFGVWIAMCSFMNKFHLPNFFCLDKIVGSFLTGFIKIGVFIGIIWLLGLEMMRRYINNNKTKEGLTPGQSSGTGNANSPSTNSPSASGNIQYNANNLDSYASVNPEIRGSDKEAQQKQFDISLNLLDPYPVYYEPGSFPFSSTGFLPSYEDSVYLSDTTKLSQVATIKNAPYLQGGFCTQFASDDQMRNAKCGALSADTCASTSCCVLVGGTKCVAGDAGGPTIKSVFSDVTIPNRDYWYYQGKCSGNCP